MYYRYTEFPQFHIQSPLNRKAIRIQASKVNGRSSNNNNSNIPPILKSAIIRLTALYYTTPSIRKFWPTQGELKDLTPLCYYSNP